MSEPTGIPHDAMPRDDEPGGSTTPLDTSGDGPVTLTDRSDPDTKTAPATNQAKAEPIPPTPGHRDPTAERTPPTLQEMNVGATDPQRPRPESVPVPPGPLAGSPPTTLGSAGSAPHEQRPASVSGSSTGSGAGPANPASLSDGESHRAAGLQGATGRGEAVETDVHAGAARMQGLHPDSSTPDVEVPGDAGTSPAASTSSSYGTSEELTVVQGVRLPDADEAGRA